MSQRLRSSLLSTILTLIWYIYAEAQVRADAAAVKKAAAQQHQAVLAAAYAALAAVMPVAAAATI